MGRETRALFRHRPKTRSVTRHGDCRRCGRRTYCTMPLKVCNGHCAWEMYALVWAAKMFGVTL